MAAAVGSSGLSGARAGRDGQRVRGVRAADRAAARTQADAVAHPLDASVHDGRRAPRRGGRDSLSSFCNGAEGWENADTPEFKGHAV